MPTRPDLPDPRDMTPQARRADVAAILAAGARRLLTGGGLSAPAEVALDSEPGGLEASEPGGRDLTCPGVSTPDTERHA